MNRTSRSRWRLAVVAVCAVAFSGLAAAQDTQGVRTDESRIYLGRPNHEPSLVYRFAQVPYKPYIEILRSPAGVNVLRDAPADHLHHHGLMFATRVDGINFWEERDNPGAERHRGPVEARGIGAARQILSGTIDWVDTRDNKPLLIEDRSIELYNDGDLDATVATWQSRFSLPEGKAEATVTGTNYNGLGMRFVESMDKGGRFFNADGKTAVAGTNDVQSKWTAYTAQAEGKPVTVAVFNHPDNPRSPARWFTMDEGFAYLAATLNLDDEPLVITIPVTLRYGIAVWDGEATPDRVDKVYDRWLGIVNDSSWRTVETGQ